MRNLKMTKDEEIKALQTIIKSTEEFIEEVKKEFPNPEARKALSHVEYHLHAVTRAHFFQPSLP